MHRSGSQPQGIPARRASRRPDRSTLACWVAGALGVGLGVTALRGYFVMVVMNAAENAPPLQMLMVALPVWVAALGGWLPARFGGGQRPVWRFALLLAALIVLRQALPGATLSPALAFAVAVAWCWWLPAFLHEAGQRTAPMVLPAALILGFAVQVAGQSAMQGLDLMGSTGPWSVVGTALIGGAFLVAMWHSAPRGGVSGPTEAASPDASTRGAATRAGSGGAVARARSDRAMAGAGSGGAVARGVVAFWLYLFLQLTGLSQVARVEVLTGWHLLPASTLVQAGLLAALLALAWSPPRSVRIALGALAVILLVPDLLAGLPAAMSVFALLPVQAGLAVALGAAFAPPVRSGRGSGISLGRTYAGAALGGVIFLVLVFQYGASFGQPLYWTAAAAVLVLIGALSDGRHVCAIARPAAALVLCAAVGLGVAAIPRLGAGDAAAGGVDAGAAAGGAEAGAAPTGVRILNYNIHQGLNNDSAPGIQALAAVIEAQNPDLVTLQEVPRGSSLTGGGSDLVPWLRWRFPNYYVVDGPRAGDNFVNVIMSRLPVSAWGFERFQPVVVPGVTAQASPPRGLVWATIPTRSGDLLLVSTHLSAYAGYDADRNAQADTLIRFWGGRERTLIAGDMNAKPAESPVQRLLVGGLRDLPAAFGLGETPTYSAGEPEERIDYVFGSPDLTPVSATVPETLASDHLPVLVTVRLP